MGFRWENETDKQRRKRQDNSHAIARKKIETQKEATERILKRVKESNKDINK